MNKIFCFALISLQIFISLHPHTKVTQNPLLINNTIGTNRKHKHLLKKMINNTQQLIDEQTNEDTKKNFLHQLQHLLEYQDFLTTQDAESFIYRCSSPACPLNASSLYNLLASCITTNSIITNGNAFINGTLCISGALECSACLLGPTGTPGTTGTTGATGPTGATGATGPLGYAYLFAYDSTTQTPTTTFTDITFSTNGANDANWIHVAGSTDFTAQIAGTYLVTILLYYAPQTSFVTTAFYGTISSQATINAIPIAGSESYLRSNNDNTLSPPDYWFSHNLMRRSFLVTVNQNDVLRIQHATSTNNSGAPAGFLAPNGNGVTPISASISIVHVK